MNSRQFLLDSGDGICQLGRSALEECAPSLLLSAIKSIQVLRIKKFLQSLGQSLPGCRSMSQKMLEEETIWGGMERRVEWALTATRGKTDVKITDPMHREQMGSAMTHPLYSTQMEDMMTPALPSVSARTCKYTAYKETKCISSKTSTAEERADKQVYQCTMMTCS